MNSSEDKPVQSFVLALFLYSTTFEVLEKVWADATMPYLVKFSQLRD